MQSKKNKKTCQFFVVSGNGQALLGMPDTDALNIIKTNIDSVDAEVMKNKEFHANTKTIQGSNTKQEKDGGGRCCTNTDSSSKSANNSTKSMVKTNPDKAKNYFLAGPKCDSDTKKSAETTQQIHKEFDDVFNGNGCFEGTFSLQIRIDSKPYQVPPWCICMHCRSHYRKNWKDYNNKT